MLKHFFSAEFLRYLFASGAAFIVDFGGLFVLVEYFYLHYLVAAMFSFTLGVVVIYLLSIHWVFDQRRLKNQHAEAVTFFLIGVVGLIINEVGLYLLTEKVGFYYMLSKVWVTGVVFAWNFLARKMILFNPSEHGR